MPIHDWTRVRAGTFHNFHQLWTANLCQTLNAGHLPHDYFAMVDQRTSGLIPDVLALHTREPGSGLNDSDNGTGGLAVATAPPKARFMTESVSDAQIYARRANRITIRHDEGDVVAVIEIVSPGNKGSQRAFREFIDKSVELLERGVHVLIIDLFPPSRRDPQGIHHAVWNEIQEEVFELPPDKPLTCASYSAGTPIRAFVDPLAVGDRLPDASLFLSPERYIPAPLESTYTATWNGLPPAIRTRITEAP